MTPLVEITLISLLLSVAMTLITKFLSNQEAIKEAKKEMEFLKKKVKEAQKTGNQKDVKRYSSMMMSRSKDQFRHNMKPMMVTMVVVLVAFSFLRGQYDGFSSPIENGAARFTYGGADAAMEIKSDTLILDGQSHKLGEFVKYGGAHWVFTKDKETLRATLFAAKAPFGIPFMGNHLSWFWVYVLITLPTNILFRKLLGIEQ